MRSAPVSALSEISTEFTAPLSFPGRAAGIAAQTGVVELSTFNRAFRRRFGGTPRGVRSQKNHYEE
jgi:hypothetical protein